MGEIGRPGWLEGNVLETNACEIWMFFDSILLRCGTKRQLLRCTIVGKKLPFSLTLDLLISWVE